MTDMDFSSLRLPGFLVKSLTENGFVTPTPIQEKAIPAQLEGQDILGIAETGSGKTAAFGLPVLAGLSSLKGKPEPKTARALILVPTRELAVQIEEALRGFSKGRKFSTLLVLGGMSRQNQVRRIAQGVDILIATPGRLMDLFQDRKVRLDAVKFLVLDEADRMLDMGFIKPVREIAAAIGADRQTVLFSATMAPEVGKLAQGLLNDPVRVEVAPQGSVTGTIDQQAVLVSNRDKRDHLNGMLADSQMHKVIIFSRTKHGADRVAKNLAQDGHTVAAIHGNKTQGARQNALKGFRDGRVRILVATDIAARGIDVPDISHVVNYELPDDPENYVHRIGRTGRNGASGTAITLIDPSDKQKLRQVERLTRTKLELVAADGEAVSSRAARGEDRPARGEGRPARGGKRPARGEGRPAKADGDEWNSLKPARNGGKPARNGKPRWNKKQKDEGRERRRANANGNGKSRKVDAA